MNKKLVIIAVGIAALLCGAYFGSPYWAARQFKEAALSADIDRLDAAVDFPAVRESLKSQMMVALTAKMESDPELKSNPFAGLGMMMIPTIVDKMINTMVTPEGMSALIKRGRMGEGGSDRSESPDVNYSYQFRTLDRFAVTVSSPGVKVEDAPQFIFERRGFFTWKVIRLELPDSLFENKS